MEKIFIKLSILTIVFVLFFSFHLYAKDNKEVIDMELKVESKAFFQNGKIPSKYTCDGIDVSPPLKWSNGPDGTKSYAIIADDPDAPVGTWVHWVIYNIPSNVTSLPEDLPKSQTLDNGSLQGKNDFKKIGYGGPCPPGGTHRYYFKVYAIDAVLDVGAGLTKKQLLKAMDKHILAKGEIIGKYSR